MLGRFHHCDGHPLIIRTDADREDIQRLTGGMLAERTIGLAIAASAFMPTSDLQRGDILVVIAAGERLHAGFEPSGYSRCHGTGERNRRLQGDRPPLARASAANRQRTDLYGLGNGACGVSPSQSNGTDLITITGAERREATRPRRRRPVGNGGHFDGAMAGRRRHW